MQVRLVKHTPDPELTIAAAARLCYSNVSAGEILQRLGKPATERLLRQVISSGHHSTLEHASFTFAIDGISRATSHQLVRHRLASYSQQSQRWVTFTAPEYVTPPSVAGRPELGEAYEQAMRAAFDLYGRLRDAGVPAEDARYVLPNATCTRLVMTMNARELIHVASIRLCQRAQWEIVQLFELVKQEVSQVAPIIGEHLRPKCETAGYCDETESCGRMPKRDGG